MTRPHTRTGTEKVKFLFVHASRPALRLEALENLQPPAVSIHLVVVFCTARKWQSGTGIINSFNMPPCTYRGVPGRCPGRQLGCYRQSALMTLRPQRLQEGLSSSSGSGLA